MITIEIINRNTAKPFDLICENYKFRYDLIKFNKIKMNLNKNNHVYLFTEHFEEFN